MENPGFIGKKEKHNDISHRKMIKSETANTGGSYDFAKVALSSLGNSAVSNMMSGTFIQTKLKVSKSGDFYEKQADKAAEQVMNTGSANNTPPELHTIQAKNRAGTLVNKEAEQGIKGLKGKGSLINKHVRDYFEPRFGKDLGNVRIHTGDKAEKLAGDLNARAFTHRNNIVFAKGQYQPDTKEGKSLIAHELAHVQQQGNLVQRKPAREKDPGEPEKKKQDDIVVSWSCPHRLGANPAGFKSKDDYKSGDFDEVDTTFWEDVKMHPYRNHSPFMMLAEMMTVLGSLGGQEGIVACRQFASKSTATRKIGPELTEEAKNCGTVNRNLLFTHAILHKQLKEQFFESPNPVIDVSKLKITPFHTSFKFSDSTALKAVIGGVQLDELYITGFDFLRTGEKSAYYKITLDFHMHDVFGAGREDLYFSGLIPFYILQHKYGYPPHIQYLTFERTIEGYF